MRFIPAEVLDRDGITKWASMESIFDQLVFHRDGVKKPMKYAAPRTRGVMITHDTIARLGSYAILIHRNLDEFTLCSVGNTACPITPEIFHKVHDCDFNNYPLISQQPLTYVPSTSPPSRINIYYRWQLSLDNARGSFCYRHMLRLPSPVHPSERDLALNAPWSAVGEGDELIFGGFGHHLQVHDTLLIVTHSCRHCPPIILRILWRSSISRRSGWTLHLLKS